MKKKLIALVTILVMLVLTVAGCTPPTPAQSSSSSKPADSKQESKSAEKKQIKLKLATFSTDFSTDWVAKEFMKLNPGYTVEFEFLPSANYYGKIMTYAASNEMPDVFFTQSANYIDHTKKGLLTDLTSYLDTPSYEGDMKWGDTFIPAVLDSARSILKPIQSELKGKYYAMPYAMTSVAVMYDKKLFAKVGIQPPKTWAEFMSNNEKLKQAGYIPFSLVTEWIDWYPRIFWDQYLGEEIAKDPTAFETGKLTFSDKRVQQGLLGMKEMWDKGYLNESGLTANSQDVTNTFIQRKLAQYMLTPTRLKYLMDNAPKDMDLATFVLPGINGKPPKTLGGSSMLVGVSSSTKEFEGALRLAKFLTSKTLYAMPEMKYQNASIKNVKKDPSLDQIMKGYADAAENGFIPEILVPAEITPQMREVFMQEIVPGLMLGKTNVDEISKKLQELYKTTYLDKKK